MSPPPASSSDRGGSGSPRGSGRKKAPAKKKAAGKKAAGKKAPAKKAPGKKAPGKKKPAAKKKAAARKSSGSGDSQRSVFWRARRIVFVLILLAIVGLGGAAFALDRIELPDEEALSETSFVCLADVGDGDCGPDNSVARFNAEQHRVLLDYDDMPRVLVEAVIAAEDKYFFEHSGLDPVGITRALYRDLTTDGVTQGGSTITQQYVKTVFLSSEKTLTRKVKEAALAIKLEKRLTKEEILERYLNVIYFGRGAYGIEAASRAYYGKPARDLTLSEAALLAGLIRAPETAEPTSEPDEAERRRRTVLASMEDVGSISGAEAEEAEAVPLGEMVLDEAPEVSNTTVTADFAANSGEYIAEWVRQEITDQFGTGSAYTEGLRVYLTIHPDLQRAAYAAVLETFDTPEDPSSALVSVDNAGRIISMVGGQDFASSQVNYALGVDGGGSGRQPGSTFKPFALAAFVEAGNSVDSVYPAPAELVLPRANDGKDWTVRNFKDTDHGTVTVEQATWNSVNTAYAQIMKEVGAGAVAEMANRAGIGPQMPAHGSVVLGTSEVSVLDMATAFSTFSNHGVLKKPYLIRRVEDSTGNVLFEQGEPETSEAMSPDVADTVSATLRGVITKGSGAAAIYAKPAAGKTGTTQDSKDAWFVGYTCDVTTAVWVGYPTPRPMENIRGKEQVTGGTFPADIWRRYMKVATATHPDCSYRPIDAGGALVNPELEAGPPTTTTTTTIPPSTTTTVPAEETATSAPTTAPPATEAPPPEPPPAPDPAAPPDG